MARKKITPEEELPKTVTAESSETADGGDIVQAGPPPGNSETAVVGAKTSSAEETGRAAEENAAEAVSLEESGECIPADIPAEKATPEKELAPSADGALVEEALHGMWQSPLLWKAYWRHAAKKRKIREARQGATWEM